MFLEFGMSDQSGEISGRKESNCVRCRNHGLKIVLRGHKQYCPYAACSCDKCRFTAEQQRQMRLQNAIRRAEGQNGSTTRRQRNSTSSAQSMSSQQELQQIQVQIHAAPPQPQQPQIQQQQQVQHQQIIVTTVASSPPIDHRNGGSPNGTNFLVIS